MDEGKDVSDSMPWRRQNLLNAWVDDPSMDELLGAIGAGTAGIVFTINPDHLCNLQEREDFLRAYRQADIVTCDSHYVQIAMRLLGRPIRNRLPGSDIVPALCRRFASDPAVTLFLLGAKPGVAQRAADRINAAAGRTMVVGALGPSMRFVEDATEIDAAIEQINRSGATVLVVGLGAPKQEIFIANVRSRLPGVGTLLGVGATIDYEAGEVIRAPVWMRRMGMEWLHRVLSEPRRYLMRYVRSSRFFWWALLERLGLYKDPLAGRVPPPAR